MLDYYSLRHAVKAGLLGYWQSLDIAPDPLVWAWIARAMSRDGTEGHPIMAQAMAQVTQWLGSNEPWIGDAHLGSVGIICSVLRQASMQIPATTAERLGQRMEILRGRRLGKFSRLNDPDAVFGIAQIAPHVMSGDALQWLSGHCIRNARPGNWRRRLLFSAAAYELGAQVASFRIDASELQLHDVIISVWFAQTYPALLKDPQNREELWGALEKVYEAISLQMIDAERAAAYTASPIDVAMLYEALTLVTRESDPKILFKNSAWHADVRGASESLFMKGEYVMAVFEAGVVFVDAVKRKAGYPRASDGKVLDGVGLMQHVFGSKQPLLKFTQMRTQSEQNEHRGLALIAEGIVSAIRNPKGHMPKHSIPLAPYEALEQLGIVSYLMRRLDSSMP